MDLVYMPEVLNYGSFRCPQYRDYEQPWNENYFNYGKSTTGYHHHNRQQQQRSPVPRSKDSCHLCKESKRRRLAAYIKGKSRLNSCSEITEEDEEVAECEADHEESKDAEAKYTAECNKTEKRTQHEEEEVRKAGPEREK